MSDPCVLFRWVLFALQGKESMVRACRYFILPGRKLDSAHLKCKRDAHGCCERGSPGSNNQSCQNSCVANCVLHKTVLRLNSVNVAPAGLPGTRLAGNTAALEGG